ICGLITDIKVGFFSEIPDPEGPLISTLESLWRNWNELGKPLLGGVENWTEPEVLPDEAHIVGVYPVMGSGGTAYPFFDLVCITCVETNPVPKLPEMLRLAWLLSQLNLNLPKYSETITPARLPFV